VVRAAVRALVESCPDVRLDARELDEIEVVLQEACTNVVRHAHRGDRDKPFRVRVRRLPDGLEFEVEDRGAPFELGQGRPPDPESLAEGGYGVHIMRTWMDEVSVRHEGGGNVLRLVRRYRAETAHREAAVGHGS
jgi:serine/threonine-protein kinase RsbW